MWRSWSEPHTPSINQQETIINDTGKTLYTGGTRTTSGGRDGAARGTGGRLDIKLSSPGARAACQPAGADVSTVAPPLSLTTMAPSTPPGPIIVPLAMPTALVRKLPTALLPAPA